MKQIKIATMIFSLAFSINTFANINSVNGFYIRGGLTTAAYTAPDGLDSDAALFPISLYLQPTIGYRFNDYLAVESSYNDLRNSSNGPQKETWTDSNGNELLSYMDGPNHYRLYFFDLDVKGIIPFENGLSLFGKAGAALTHQDAYNEPILGEPPSVNSNTNAIQPLLGAGVSYNFTKNVAVDLTFTHLFANGSVADINTLGLGVTYTFGSDG
jgi:opacity protein-like surface antigen